jgi:phage-related protein
MNSGGEKPSSEGVGSDIAKVGSSFQRGFQLSRSTYEIFQAFQELAKSVYVTFSTFTSLAMSNL